MRIEIYADNPRYFRYHDQPVFLAGSTVEDGWTPISQTHVDYVTDIADNAATGGNMARITPFFQGHDLMPWVQLPRGRFDLEKFNPPFWQRLRDYLERSEENGVVVAIEVWEDVGVRYENQWYSSPWNPRNNINYGISQMPMSSPSVGGVFATIPMYQTVPELNNREIALGYQRLYADKLLETTHDLPNVLYCLGNETYGPVEWMRYWARYIHAYGERQGTKLIVGEMPQYSYLPLEAVLKEAIFDYADLSQWVSFQTSYPGPRDIWTNPARLVQVPRETTGRIAAIANVFEQCYLETADNPKPLAAAKTYLYDTSWLWIKFIAGGASGRLHRPGSFGVSGRAGFPNDTPWARQAIRNLTSFVRQTRFWEMAPHSELVAATPSNSDGYALAAPGQEYVVYLLDRDLATNPGGTLALDMTGGVYEVSFYDPKSGERAAGSPSTVSGGEGVKIAVPRFRRDIVAHLVARA
jgi:hypothetical protein